MSSFISKEIFSLSLCLITLFFVTSCASSSRSVAEESSVKRSPPGDGRSTSHKITSRQFANERY